MRIPLLAAVAALVLAGGGAAPAAADAIGYRTLFQDPGAVPGQDFSLENHAIALIDATPAGERITFAFRDFNRDPVADALIRAHDRGVTVEGVVDGGERGRDAVQRLAGALGNAMVICGSPAFVWNSCIADSITPSLQHNKFLTFSGLADGRRDVVLETSENFLFPSQYSYYNDMVEIDGDHALHDGYVGYVHQMQAQVRSDDNFRELRGDDGRDIAYLSPRRQPDFEHDDTIVDRLDEIDCSGGGTVRVANMAFRSERAVIMRKLIQLHDAGCDVDVILSNADGDILAGLVSAGIPVHPFFLRAADGRPQVMVHDKFMLVDARSTLTGERTKITYAGTSNWRADEQYSDDLLLRIVDDGVYDAYERYWELIRSRAQSRTTVPASDTTTPSSALTVTPAPNAAGWNRGPVTLRVAASDGHNVPGASGILRLRVETTGAQTGTQEFTDEHDGYVVGEIPVSAEGATTVTWFAEDGAHHVETPHTTTIRIDSTPPVISGLPKGCELWPPDGRMVHVADVTADDGDGSGVAGLDVTATGGDAAIDGGSVDLRAEKAAQGGERSYVVTAVATDVAGNRAEASSTCVVPRSRGDAVAR